MTKITEVSSGPLFFILYWLCMLKYYVRRSSGEDFQKVATPPKDNVWIHGDSVTEEELAFLAQAYGFNRNILVDVLDKNELPRVEQQDDGLYVFVRTAQRNKNSQVITRPMLLAVRGTIFINLSEADTANHALAVPSVIAQSSDTTSLLLGTFATTISEYETLMQRTGNHIAETENRLRTHEVTNDDFIRFVTVENNLNEYRTSLNGMQAVGERLREHMTDDGDLEALDDILLYIRQLIVIVTSHVHRVTSIRNAYGTIANNVLNQRMKTLTVLTLMIALPNVFFGMYGMNVALPFQTAAWAYGSIMMAGIAVTVIVYIVAKKRGIF